MSSKNLLTSIILTLLAGCLLVGCAPTVWTKPGVTQQDWLADSYLCERDMRGAGFDRYRGNDEYAALANAIATINAQQFYKRCLMARGYSQVKQ